MAWVIKNRKTEQYITMDHVFGLPDGETYVYTSDPMAAYRAGAREDAIRTADEQGITDCYVVEI